MRHKKIFICYSDPGHSWVKVPRNLLQKLNILQKITSYSYQLRNYVYLEEDSDLKEFVDAYCTYYQCKPQFKVQNANRYSKIRTYDSYNCEIA